MWSRRYIVASFDKFSSQRLKIHREFIVACFATWQDTYSRYGTMPRQRKNPGNSTTGMSARAASWLAWSTWTFSMALTASSLLLLVLNWSNPDGYIFDYWKEYTVVAVSRSTGLDRSVTHSGARAPFSSRREMISWYRRSWVALGLSRQLPCLYGCKVRRTWRSVSRSRCSSTLLRCWRVALSSRTPSMP